MQRWQALSLDCLPDLQPPLPPLASCCTPHNALAAAGSEYLQLLPQTGSMVMAFVISAIPKSLQRPPDELHTIDLPLTMAVLKRQCTRSELERLPFIAGVDFSFNEDGRQPKRFEPFWQPHFWIYVEARTLKLLPTGLARFFPADITIPVPIMVKPVTDQIEAISYLWKSVFFRRVTYLDSTGRLNSRKVPLKPAQERELRVYLDQYAPTDRLCVNGLQRRGCRYEWVGRFAQ